MISYKPFYKLLKERKISTYELVHKYKISSNLLHRLRNNMNITTKQIDKLCELFDCDISDIMCREKTFYN